MNRRVNIYVGYKCIFMYTYSSSAKIMRDVCLSSYIIEFFENLTHVYIIIGMAMCQCDFKT